MHFKVKAVVLYFTPPTSNTTVLSFIVVGVDGVLLLFALEVLPLIGPKAVVVNRPRELPLRFTVQEVKSKGQYPELVVSVVPRPGVACRGDFKDFTCARICSMSSASAI